MTDRQGRGNRTIDEGVSKPMTRPRLTLVPELTIAFLNTMGQPQPACIVSARLVNALPKLWLIVLAFCHNVPPPKGLPPPLQVFLAKGNARFERDEGRTQKNTQQAWFPLALSVYHGVLSHDRRQEEEKEEEESMQCPRSGVSAARRRARRQGEDTSPENAPTRAQPALQPMSRVAVGTLRCPLAYPVCLRAVHPRHVHSSGAAGGVSPPAFFLGRRLSSAAFACSIRHLFGSLLTILATPDVPASATPGVAERYRAVACSSVPFVPGWFLGSRLTRTSIQVPHGSVKKRREQESCSTV